MAKIETARGPIDGSALGRTLAHEHIINVTDWIARDFPDAVWDGDRAKVVAYIRKRLADIKAKGFSTLIDCTGIGHSRDVATVMEANAGIDFNIVLSTGIYTYNALPIFFKYRPPSRRSNGSLQDVMMDFFVRDIRDGIQGTNVKAAVIKCVTDIDGVTENVDRVLRATARAHRETGAPITTHTNAKARTGLEQQRVFREEGVDLSRVVIGHSGDTDNYDYLQALLDAGSYIGADRFGFNLPGWDMPTTEKRIEIVKTLVDRGYEDRILLSQDTSIFTDWWPGLGNIPDRHPKEWRLEFIVEEVAPAMLKAGIPQRAIDKMLIDNPRRYLENNTAY